jgi:putative transposase
LDSDLSDKEQCKLLGLQRSSYYYQHADNFPDKETIMRLIDEHYLEHPHEGSRKVSHMLKQKGYDVGRCRARSLMKEMGIEAIYPKPNTSAPCKEHKVYPYLLKETEIIKPKQVWCTDLTYAPLLGSHVYLIAIMDWYSRYVIEWALSTTMEAEFCVGVLEQALSHSCCEIFNTDQGSQFTSQAWINTLKKRHISISMDGRGRYLDSIFIERLWRSVKQECIYRSSFESVKEVKIAMTRYFKYYNEKRPHQSLDYRTPAEVYFHDL